MAVGEKYIALTAYLEKCGQSSIKMTFKEKEQIHLIINRIVKMRKGNVNR